MKKRFQQDYYLPEPADYYLHGRSRNLRNGNRSGMAVLPQSPTDDGYFALGRNR